MSHAGRRCGDADDATPRRGSVDNVDVPEILEVEMYAEAARAVVGRRVSRVSHLDPLVVNEPGLIRGIEGRRISAVTRHGKVLTLHTSGFAIDLHFGMAGRIVVDGRSPIDELSYAASDDSKWIRFGLTFGKGFLWVSDPRRFARVQPARNGEGLGPDAMLITKSEFRERVAERSGAIKAVLLDQSTIAGLGNMLVDEILWRSRISPHRPACDLTTAEVTRLHRETGRVLPELMAAGGSHAGKLSAERRVPGSLCPRDGAELARTVCGGRTTYACPLHQT